jgi:hypothetical protein
MNLSIGAKLKDEKAYSAFCKYFVIISTSQTFTLGIVSMSKISLICD